MEALRRKNLAVALAVTGFAGVGMAVPFVIRRLQKERLIDKEAPLSGSQTQRGVFLNTGSKDVGRDPEWDKTTGMYRGKQ